MFSTGLLLIKLEDFFLYRVQLSSSDYFFFLCLTASFFPQFFIFKKFELSIFPMACDFYMRVTPILGFPGGSVVKNLPANEGDTGLFPGPGGSDMPGSN